MWRTLLIVASLFGAVLATTLPVSARLGMAPMSSPDDAVIQVKGGHGHGHGHHGHRGGHGHHYGWHRGRGHHYGWHHHHRFY